MKVARACPPALLVAALVALSAHAACTSPTAPSNYAPFTKTDLVVGTGSAALGDSTVTVEYTGWLYDASKPENKGAVFSTTAGYGPFTFTLGAGSVIAGWELGIPGMAVGGTRRLVIPPSLGYGASRQGAIPPYATLIFEIKLNEVQ